MRAPVLDPELLKAFVAVAEQRSFTRAAVALHRTQSAVSMQIKRLEERLGAELFARDRSPIGLTAAGEGLLGYARRILALSDEAIGQVGRSHDRLEGRVRIGAMDDYGSLLLPPLLATFAAHRPRIEVDVETGLTSTMTGRVGQAYDLVLAMHPLGSGGGQQVCREQAVWAAGPGNAIETQDPLPVALYPMGCLFRQWAIDALDRAGRPWRLAFVSQSLAAVEAIAAQGLAVTVVKRGTFPARLRALTARDGMPKLPAADIRLHRSPTLSRTASLLADHIAAGLARPNRA